MRRISGAMPFLSEPDECVFCHDFRPLEQFYRHPERVWMHVACEERERLWKTHVGL